MGPVEFSFQDQISPLGEEIRNLAYGAGVFVITTSSSSVLYSSDGLSWDTVSGITGSISLNRLVWSGDAFYISSFDSPNNRVYRSTDGINWTNTYSNTTSRSLKTAANGYAYGGEYRTNNGSSFESITVSGGWSLDHITFGNGVYVASAAGLYYRSTNGTTFSQIVALSNSGFGGEPVVWSSVREQFVAWLSGPDEFSERGMYVSDDGTTWTLVAHVPPEYSNTRGLTAVAYGNGLALMGALETEGSSGLVYLADNEDVSYEANEVDNPFSGVALSPRFLAYNGEFFLAANFDYNDGGFGAANYSTDVIRINAAAEGPPEPEQVVCFWTDFNKSYEICEGIGGGGSLTPEWSPQSDWPAIDDPGDTLRINETLEGEIYGNSISEPVQYGYNYFAGDGFGDPETILFIAKIPGIGDATGVTWAYNKVSGFDRSFQVNQIIGEYVLFDIQFDYGEDGFNAEHPSVYEFVGTYEGSELPAITLDFVIFSGLF